MVNVEIPRRVSTPNISREPSFDFGISSIFIEPICMSGLRISRALIVTTPGACLQMTRFVLKSRGSGTNNSDMRPPVQGHYCGFGKRSLGLCDARNSSPRLRGSPNATPTHNSHAASTELAKSTARLFICVCSSTTDTISDSPVSSSHETPLMRDGCLLNGYKSGICVRPAAHGSCQHGSGMHLNYASRDVRNSFQ